MRLIAVCIAAAWTMLAAPAPAAPETIERVANADTADAYEATPEEVAGIYAHLALWSDANAEGWRRLIDVFALPDGLVVLADDPAGETARGAWGTDFDRAVTEASFFIDRRPPLPRLFLLGADGERLRDALYVTNASQQDALDAIAAIGTAMSRDARAILAGEPDAAAARERLRLAAAETEAMRALIRDHVDDLTRIGAAARADDRAAVAALAARLSARDVALRDLTRRRRI
ncbi:MAG: hypothetical protein GC206_08450 [Alphaproteobacteria bacterium]|nr:hypothetical protein [Alphaproteobacteria bacterium]